jgi:hypothetical protein
MILSSAFSILTAQAQTTKSALDASVAGTALKDRGDLVPLIGQLVIGLLGILSVLFVILMMYGGFKWMNARGDAAEVKKAQDIISAAIIGLIIIASSYAITVFIFSQSFI